jgi:preprotein translocase subunit YajC
MDSGRPAGERKVNRKDAPMLGINELAATSTKSSGFNPSTLILILVVVVAFYLLMIRPQQRRKQQAQQQQNTLAPGSRVKTTAGMYATVVAMDGDDVILEVAPGVEVRYMRRAVMEVLTPGEAEEPVEDVDSADEAPEDYDTTAHDADDIADDDTPESDADAEGSAYEQATGTKKD